MVHQGCFPQGSWHWWFVFGVFRFHHFFFRWNRDGQRRSFATRWVCYVLAVVFLCFMVAVVLFCLCVLSFACSSVSFVWLCSLGWYVLLLCSVFGCCFGGSFFCVLYVCVVLCCFKQQSAINRRRKHNSKQHVQVSPRFLPPGFLVLVVSFSGGVLRFHLFFSGGTAMGKQFLCNPLGFLCVGCCFALFDSCCCSMLLSVCCLLLVRICCLFDAFRLGGSFVVFWCLLLLLCGVVFVCCIFVLFCVGLSNSPQ